MRSLRSRPSWGRNASGRREPDFGQVSRRGRRGVDGLAVDDGVVARGCGFLRDVGGLRVVAQMLQDAEVADAAVERAEVFVALAVGFPEVEQGGGDEGHVVALDLAEVQLLAVGDGRALVASRLVAADLEHVHIGSLADPADCLGAGAEALALAAGDADGLADVAVAHFLQLVEEFRLELFGLGVAQTARRQTDARAAKRPQPADDFAVATGAVLELLEVRLEILLRRRVEVGEEQILVGRDQEFGVVGLDHVADHRLKLLAVAGRAAGTVGLRRGVGVAVDEPAVLDVQAVGEVAVVLLRRPAVVEVTGADVEAVDRLLESRAGGLDLIPIPLDALRVDDVFESRPVPVLAVAPLLVDLDDAVEALVKLVGREDAQRQAERAEGAFAVLLALSAADVDLEGGELAVLDDGGDAAVVRAQLHAVVRPQLVPVAVDGGKRELELAVEQVRPVLEPPLGPDPRLGRVAVVGGVDAEDLHVRLLGELEVRPVLVGHLHRVVNGAETAERAGHDIARVIAAAVECEKAGFGDVAHDADQILFVDPVELNVLPRGKANGRNAVGAGRVFPADVVDDPPLLPPEAAAAGDADADHVHPVLFLAGLGAVVLEVDAVALGKGLGLGADALVVHVAEVGGEFTNEAQLVLNLLAFVPFRLGRVQ